MKSKKVLILAVIFILLTSIFAMSDDGDNKPTVVKKEVKSTEVVKDRFGVDTGMSKEKYNQFTKDYYAKAKELELYHRDPLFYNKVNLNKKKEFDKYKIHLGASLDMCNLNDFIIRSELIIIGTYEGVEIDKDKKSKFPVTFKVKVNKVIANETEYEIISDNIIVKGMNLYNHPLEKLKSMLKGDFNKNFVMFLARDAFFNYKKVFDKGKADTYVSDDCFAPYTFTFLGFSQREIKNNNKIVFSNTMHPASPKFKIIDMQEFEESVKEILEINDKDNFYKRSYK
ncbi:MAG: hypothetical protein PF638_00655 [Candidatus Delongbacteria bacterium]|jgi:hypothetical protein|nr:hypothetical protein [Candidatus Delongbacteria bacterium]